MATIALLYFPALMIFAAISDLFTMRISNGLVLALAIGFFPFAYIGEMPWDQLGLHLLCAFVVLLVSFSLFAFRLIGGGDAKLVAATALWLGFAQVVPYLLYAALFGGALTLIILALRSLPLEVWIVRVEWLSRLHDRKQGVPYGIALAAAGLLVYPMTSLFIELSA